MVAYVKVSVVRKSLANCGVRVQIPLGVLVHNCFCFTLKHSLKTMLYLIILIRVVRFLRLLTKLICVFHIILLPLYCNSETK